MLNLARKNRILSHLDGLIYEQCETADGNHTFINSIHTVIVNKTKDFNWHYWRELNKTWRSVSRLAITWWTVLQIQKGVFHCNAHIDFVNGCTQVFSSRRSFLMTDMDRVQTFKVSKHQKAVNMGVLPVLNECSTCTLLGCKRTCGVIWLYVLVHHSSS